MYDLYFLATRKDNKQAAVNAVRDKVQNNEIIIHPRCVNLISHLKNAVWDKQRKSFKRTKEHHYDFLDSLIYLIRNVDYVSNPYPNNYGLTGDFISPKYSKIQQKSQFENFLQKLVEVRRPKNRG